MEPFFFIVVVLVALVPFWRKRRQPLLAGGGIAAGVVAFAAAGALVWQSRTEHRLASRRKMDQALPRQVRDGGFVSSGACKACHPEQYASWHSTYHRTMTQAAGPATVLGRFDGIRLESHGQRYQLSRRGDEYWVEMAASGPQRPNPASPWHGSRGADGRSRVERRVVMTTGSHHMQLYWVPGGSGNLLDQLPFVYLFEDERWIPVEDSLLMPPGSHLNQQWNIICLYCHSVGGQPRADSFTGVMSTRVAELGISCEACHGPADEHVRANRDPARRYRYHFGDEPDPTIVHPGRCSPQRSAQICGHCHGIAQFAPDRHMYGDSYRAGDDLDQTRRVVRPRQMPASVQERFRREEPNYLEGQFWSDGMVRVSGREYNGLVDSACHQRGRLSCLSCHSMHESDANDQLTAGMDGNQACYPCHESHRAQLEEHTHHAAASAGSNCYNCHMPYTTYGLLKAIRSHQIDSPSVQASVETGRPNACNLCHLDRTLAWTAQHLSQWYGAAPVELDLDQRSVSAALLWLLRGDAGQRALLAWGMGWEPAHEASGKDWLAPFLAQLLNDPYSTVRYIARRSLGRLPGYEGFAYDFLAPPAQRARARDEAVRRWDSSRAAASRRAGGPILLDAAGALRQDTIDRLLDERDDRPVQLLE